MTREERLKAGWVEERTFRIRVRRKGEVGEWLACGSGGTIWAANRRDIAEQRAKEMRGVCYDCKWEYSVVPFITLVKPKAPPPLKVGDEVLVRATVEEFNHGHFRDLVLRTPSNAFWLSSKDVVRAAKESK